MSNKIKNTKALEITPEPLFQPPTPKQNGGVCKVSLIEPLSITIDARALLKLYYVQSLYDKEFQCYHYGGKEGNTYRLYENFWIPQENTATTTNTDGEDVVGELCMAGADISLVNSHSHSHVNMGVTPSGRDGKDIEEKTIVAPFNASIIINKKGDIYGHIRDKERNIYVENCDIIIDYPFTKQEMQAQIFEWVQEAADLEQVENAMFYNDFWEFFCEMYPLTQEEKDVLKQEMKKFKSVPIVNTFKSSKNTIKKSDTSWEQPVLPYGKTYQPYHPNIYNDWEDIYEGDPIVDTDNAELAMTIFTDEEIAKLKVAENKSHLELTDEESLLIEQFYLHFGFGASTDSIGL